ncbi:hypothetical protein ACM7G2_28620 [Pseudomonas aeruginosa]
MSIELNKESVEQADASSCQGTNCGTTTGDHSSECLAEAAAGQGWELKPGDLCGRDCPIHKILAEQAGGDERGALQELIRVRDWVKNRRGQPEKLKNTGQTYIMIEKCETLDMLEWAIERARAALAQPSPGQAEAERPEVVGYRVSMPDEPELGHWLEEEAESEPQIQHHEPLMTVAQHERIVASRWERAMDLMGEHVARISEKLTKERDAALDKISKLESRWPHGESPEERFEHYISNTIDRAPEPLRRLGNWLSHVLDEDQWTTAERMLTGACVAAEERAAEQTQHSVPDVCDGKEQDAFEEWARKEGLDTSCHPMHWLFLDAKTNSARQGWKAALRYVRAKIAAPGKAQHSVPEEVRTLLSRAQCEIEHLAECLENVCEDEEDFDVREDVADGRVVAADIAHMLASAPGNSVPQAWLDVQAERRRQITAEGWTPEHDDEHADGQMAQAAGCYALHAGGIGTDWPDGRQNGAALFWPWDRDSWKPTTPRRDLVKACALALAEIERLDRAGISQSPQPGATTASS